MNRNIVILILVSLFMVSLVCAGLGTFKQNDCVEIRTILNQTSVNISTISYPNSTMLILNEPMTKNSLTFNYTFCLTDQSGNYVYDYYDSDGNIYVNDFDITLNGKKKPDGIVLISFIVIFIAGFFFAIIYFFKALREFTLLEMDLFDTIILMSSYFVMWIFYYFALTYIGEKLINDFLEIAILVGAFTHVFLPLIGLFTSFILQTLKFKQKQRVTY